MTQEELVNSLEEMLANPKARNFINHLVRAYFPISRVDKVWDKSNGELKCALTRASLVTVQDLIDAVNSDDFKHNFLTYLKNSLSGGPNLVQEMIGDKKIAVRGTNTTTFMSLPAYIEFNNWILKKSLEGDKHINWLLGSIRKSIQVEKSAKKKEVEPEPQNVGRGKVSTYTIGETDAFKKLREKFKDED